MYDHDQPKVLFVVNNDYIKDRLRRFEQLSQSEQIQNQVLAFVFHSWVKTSLYYFHSSIVFNLRCHLKLYYQVFISSYLQLYRAISATFILNTYARRGHKRQFGTLPSNCNISMHFAYPPGVIKAVLCIYFQFKVNYAASMRFFQVNGYGAEGWLWRRGQATPQASIGDKV